MPQGLGASAHSPTLHVQGPEYVHLRIHRHLFKHLLNVKCWGFKGIIPTLKEFCLAREPESLNST